MSSQVLIGPHATESVSPCVISKDLLEENNCLPEIMFLLRIICPAIC